MFINREDAGRQLAEKMSHLKGQKAIVLAIPRGGVVVAAQVAKELDLPLGLIIPRKIGAPANPELAVGAVAGDGATFLNQHVINTLGISKDYLEAETKKQVEEIKRREQTYLQGKAPLSVKDKIVLVIDDGIATGATAIAAVRALKQQSPAKVILAVPVAPQESKELLNSEADEVIVLQTPPDFYAVGQFYETFEQTTDEEVQQLLEGER